MLNPIFRLFRNRIALIVGFEVILVVLSLFVHADSRLPSDYSWSRTLGLFWRAISDRYFVAFAFIVLLSSFLKSNKLPSCVDSANGYFSASLASALCVFLLFTPSAYVALDYALLIPSAFFLFIVFRERNLTYSLLGLLASIFILVVVSYSFTIIKSQLFVHFSALDNRIVSAETSVFGQPLFIIIAKWSSQHSGVVAFCDRVYFLFFHHMALTALLLFALNSIGDQWRYVFSLATCYLLGAISYYIFPALGPAFYSPSSFDYLATDAEFTFYVQNLLRKSTAAASQGTLDVVETYAFIACMPSLHMAHETIMLYFSRKSILVFSLSAAFWVLSFASVLVLGWHYLFDIFGGILLALVVLALVQCSFRGRHSD